ncbi:MAG: adenosylcobinamide-phosphate synthase CbiB [Pseudomonadota bacterium]
MSVLFAVFLALALDHFLGEPRRLHPLVGFGRWATGIEQFLNSSSPGDALGAKARGILGCFCAVAPLVATSMLIAQAARVHPAIEIAVGGVFLYIAVGWNSLHRHANAVVTPLQRGELGRARAAVAMLVSRDTDDLDEEGVARAASESILENGADAVFSAIFWFVLAGIPGVVLYRLANTLDAMWGYKTPRFHAFGWCAARVDDLLNYLPARLTAMSYALLGNTRLALHCWLTQGPNWKSPNAGPVMAAGAGALNVSLGGDSRYNQKIERRPRLGPESSRDSQFTANASTIEAACRLVDRSLALWCVCLLGLTAVFTALGH